MKSLLHVLSRKNTCEVPCVPPRGGGAGSRKGGVRDPLSELDTDSLTEQVIAQFGEEVVRREVPLAPQAKKKRDAEILKVWGSLQLHSAIPVRCLCSHPRHLFWYLQQV